ncbi:MAG: hypothetical protein SH859_13345, partial [Hyphomicrobium aestuarii]|nr:hypothetical protein [Hyphomicrobium aestuarii]
MNFDVKHYTTRAFWDHYHDLPGTTQSAADRQFELLKRDRSHPSLNFKKVGRYMHASPLSSGAVSGYVISNKEIAHDAVAAGRSVA